MDDGTHVQGAWIVLAGLEQAAVASAGRGSSGPSLNHTAITALAGIYREHAATSVTIVGATGYAADNINGTFVKLTEVQNGKSVYAKVGNKTRCLFYATDHKWTVTTVATKDKNGSSASAYSTTVHLASPELETTAWRVTEKDSGGKTAFQDRIAVTCRKGAPEDDPFSAADPLAAVHTVTSDLTGHAFPMTTEVMERVSQPYFTEDALSATKFVALGNRAFLPAFQALYRHLEDRQPDSCAAAALPEASLRRFIDNQIRRFVAVQAELSRGIPDAALQRLMEDTEARCAWTGTGRVRLACLRAEINPAARSPTPARRVRTYLHVHPGGRSTCCTLRPP